MVWHGFVLGWEAVVGTAAVAVDIAAVAVGIAADIAPAGILADIHLAAHTQSLAAPLVPEEHSDLTAAHTKQRVSVEVRMKPDP